MHKDLRQHGTPSYDYTLKCSYMKKFACDLCVLHQSFYLSNLWSNGLEYEHLYYILNEVLMGYKL